MTVETATQAVLSRDHFSPHLGTAGTGMGVGHSSAPSSLSHLIDEQQIRDILFLGTVRSPASESAPGRNIDTRA